MQIIKKETSMEFKNSDFCLVNEYPFQNSKFNLAIVKISEKYPDTGWLMNEVCEEIVYIIKGKISIVTESETVILKPADQVRILPKEKYKWFGTAEMVTVCMPSFYPEQHKLINE